MAAEGDLESKKEDVEREKEDLAEEVAELKVELEEAHRMIKKLQDGEVGVCFRDEIFENLCFPGDSRYLLGQVSHTHFVS